MSSCSHCREEVSPNAEVCPHCGEPKPACFPSSAKILTPSGWKEIGIIEVGDEVISYNRYSNSIQIQPVTKRLDHAPSLLWEIQTEEKKSVYTTVIHPFLTTKGWVQTRNLKAGDSLIGVTQSLVSKTTTIIKTTKTDRLEPVHNLHTAGDHTFVVDGYVVHNFAYFLQIRTWWHRLCIDPSGCSSIFAKQN